MWYFRNYIKWIFCKRKIKDEELKKKADDNLLNALENSSFTLKEKLNTIMISGKKTYLWNYICNNNSCRVYYLWFCKR